MTGDPSPLPGVRRITRLEPAPGGGYTPVVLYDASVTRTKKKTARPLRPVERLLRQLSDAQAAAAIEYQVRHKRSSEKRKNGWLRDLGWNLMKAQQEGSKRLKVMKIVIP